MEIDSFLVKALLAFGGGIIGFIGSYYGMVAMIKSTLKNHDECLKSLDCDVDKLKDDVGRKIEKDDIRRVHDRVDACQLKTESDKYENRVHNDLGDIKTSIRELTSKVDEYILKGVK